jgi:TM2 domain-containing membrane protein YozV
MQPTVGMMFCPNCSSQISKDAEICPKCGVRVKAPPVAYTQEKKSTGIAAVASLVIPGAGQIYCGKIGRGIMFIILTVLLGITVIFLIGILLLPIFWVYNIYDAYNLAKKINAGIIKED